MSKPEVQYELPENYDELKKAANRTSNWRERLAAVEELGKYNTDQTINVLKHVLRGDAVFPVQEAAFRKLRAFGEDVKLPPRKKGELVKGANKVFLRLKKSLPEGHAYEEFKEKLQKTRTDVYDTYEGEKGEEFDTWLQAEWAGLLQKQQ
ncbi:MULTISPECIES: HEAT repeat domain-containing protein [Paenibacillus]|uniref:HEAT repeat domain-containing protein n=1 Tax=Paenibacillus TaxID=44249 RepID=UPI0022B88D77|nr:HEAT repeat domain-containing protein [Paenibacillus caseinilyticus]MCZ8519746.1 HEAT repeat domain-containing protein [Paenibacillus caseinilyticus]